MYLTKSDFQVARTCPTKLYYKKLHYLSTTDDDPYLAFLADGGYMVESMARALYADGEELGNWDEPELAFNEVKRRVQESDGTYFEATVIHDKFLARIDILRRVGSTLRLIEVNSK